MTIHLYVEPYYQCKSVCQDCFKNVSYSNDPNVLGHEILTAVAWSADQKVLEVGARDGSLKRAHVVCSYLV